MFDLREHFSCTLGADPERLHFAAHSHHPWPDVTRAAQLEAWDLAARQLDAKWDAILGPLLAEAQGHVARHLALPDPSTIVFAPNTHELLTRLLSCFPTDRPVRVLATDGEFHTFARQLSRLREDALIELSLIEVEPFDSFLSRFCETAKKGFDLVWTSQVFFNSGFAAEDLGAICEAAGEAMLVIDGYHAFLARPTDLSMIADRAFYLAGGYKYAMAGEGACFMHCPPGWFPRPRNTGWFAAFGALSRESGGEIAYAEDARRFMGATFDATAIFRFNAAMRWLSSLGIKPGSVQAHAFALQERFVTGLGNRSCGLGHRQLVVPLKERRRGNFLTFQLAGATELHARFARHNIVTDVRGDRLRVGFGIYHVAEDVDRLLARMKDAC